VSITDISVDYGAAIIAYITSKNSVWNHADIQEIKWTCCKYSGV